MDSSEDLQPFIVDACSLINIYATGYLDEILNACGSNVYTTSYIINQEAKFIRDGSGQKIAIDLIPFTQVNLLQVTDLSGHEFDTFLNLIQEMDDGEAECISVAHHRNFIFISDDRNAMKKAIKNFPNMNIISGLELVRKYAENTRLDDRQTGEVLMKIKNHARFEPWRDHPQKGWWDARIVL